MRKIIFSLWVALVASLSVMAQKVELFNYTGEVSVGELNKQQIVQYVLDWQRKHLPKDAILKYNEHTSELTGTAFVWYDSKIHAANDLTKGYIVYDFKIVATDKGFQYKLTNFRHEAKIKFHTLTTAHSFPYKINVVEKPWYDMVWKDIKRQLDDQMPKMINTLKDATEKLVYSAVLDEKSRETSVYQIVNASAK